MWPENLTTINWWEFVGFYISNIAYRYYNKIEKYIRWKFNVVHLHKFKIIIIDKIFNEIQNN